MNVTCEPSGKSVCIWDLKSTGFIFTLSMIVVSSVWGFISSIFSICTCACPCISTIVGSSVPFNTVVPK